MHMDIMRSSHSEVRTKAIYFKLLFLPDLHHFKSRGLISNVCVIPFFSTDSKFASMQSFLITKNNHRLLQPIDKDALSVSFIHKPIGNDILFYGVFFSTALDGTGLLFVCSSPR